MLNRTNWRVTHPMRGAELKSDVNERSRAQMLAGWCADESGASRMDRIVLVCGVIAIFGFFALALMRDVAAPEDPGALAADAEPPARKFVSAAGQVAPEPPRVEGGASQRSHASVGYQQQFDRRYDNEAAVLYSQTQAAIAADASLTARPVESGDAVLAAEDPPAAPQAAATSADGS